MKWCSRETCTVNTWILNAGTGRKTDPNSIKHNIKWLPITNFMHIECTIITPFRRLVDPSQGSLPNLEATPEKWQLCVCVCVCEYVWLGVYCPLPFWGESNWQSEDGSLSRPTIHTLYIQSVFFKSEETIMLSAAAGSMDGISRGLKDSPTSDVWTLVKNNLPVMLNAFEKRFSCTTSAQLDLHLCNCCWLNWNEAEIPTHDIHLHWSFTL